jgi:hypothetical protein
MYGLNSQEFELDAFSTTDVGLFSDSSAFAEFDYDADLSAGASTDVIRGIEKNVISSSEITVMFDKFELKNQGLD